MTTRQPARSYARLTLIVGVMTIVSCIPDFPKRVDKKDASAEADSGAGAGGADAKRETIDAAMGAVGAGGADGSPSLATDASPADGSPGTCVPACVVSETRCGPNGGRQTCTSESGCAAWGPEMSCGELRACQMQGTAATCACAEDQATVTCTVGTTFCSADRTIVYRCREAGGCKARTVLDTCNAAAACAGVGNAVSCRQVSMGQGFACVLWDEKVRCWGSNQGGELGTGAKGPNVGDDEHPKGGPLVSFGTEKPVMVSTGYRNACALMRSGKVMCWGENKSGRLGIDEAGAEGAIKTPVVVPALAKATSVFTEDARTCATLEAGGVACWGVNENSTSFPPFGSLVATKVDPIGDRRAKQVELGVVFACALLENGQALCWGSQDEYLGVNDQKPFVALGGAAAQKVAVGRSHACALVGGRVSCWGRSFGTGSQSGQQPLPTEVAGVSGAIDIAANQQTCVVLGSSRSVWCWGGNVGGELGNGESGRATAEPQYVRDLPSDAIRVSAGFEATCALLSTGAVYCWGYNTDGRIGVMSAEQEITRARGPVQYE